MKVSIAMITYFHEAYVEEALKGILMQETDFDYEIVIGEDASKDATAEIISRYIKEYPNKFKVTFHENNIGMMPNFINTLKACNGKYIALCEGDDYWTDKHKLQKQVNFMDSHDNFSGCFHNVIVKDERNPVLAIKPWRSYDKEDFELVDTFSRTALFHTCSFFFRKEALEIPDWFDKVKSGDMSLFAIVASKGRLKLLPGNMGVYRKNDGGVTNDIKIVDYHKNRIKLMGYFKEHFDTAYIRPINDIIEYHEREVKKLSGNKVKNFLKRIRKS